MLMIVSALICYAYAELSSLYILSVTVNVTVTVTATATATLTGRTRCDADVSVAPGSCLESPTVRRSAVGLRHLLAVPNLPHLPSLAVDVYIIRLYMPTCILNKYTYT
jgi:hypothetical protein